jgi:hypothetical protein
MWEEITHEKIVAELVAYEFELKVTATYGGTWAYVDVIWRLLKNLGSYGLENTFCQSYDRCLFLK